MSTSVPLLQAVVLGATARGVDPGVLLETAGLEPEDLSDPDARLPLTSTLRLWDQAAHLSGDLAFGVHLAEEIQITAYGAFGYAVRASATLGDALARIQRFLRLVIDGPVLEVVRAPDRLALRHLVARPGLQAPRQGVEMFVAALAQVPIQGGAPLLRPVSASFRHAAPPDDAEQRRVLGCPVAWGAAHDEVCFRPDAWDHPLSSAEPGLALVLDRHLQDLIDRVPAAVDFRDQVRGALASELRGGEPELEHVAQRLRLSPRSLQRRLHAEDTTLQQELATLRRDLALRHLREGRESIAEIAFLLGFSEVSTFHRAFKRWTGMTPAEARRHGIEHVQSP